MAQQIGRTTTIVTTAGGNLYALAAEHYGDHTLWERIARANRITDPFLIGIVTLVIPPRPATTPRT